VQIPDAELGALDVDGKVDFTSTGEVFDITVSAVLGTAYLRVNSVSRYSAV
jgi:hypothetical protein